LEARFSYHASSEEEKRKKRRKGKRKQRMCLQRVFSKPEKNMRTQIGAKLTPKVIGGKKKPGGPPIDGLYKHILIHALVWSLPSQQSGLPLIASCGRLRTTACFINTDYKVIA